jgi:predicted membrane protein
MFRFNDIFLVIVACYVIYKIGFVDGFTLVNLFIAVCTVVAFVSTILRRSGYVEKLKEKENEAVKKREEKKKWTVQRKSNGRKKQNREIYLCKRRL